jgi:hypothetical protein
MMTPLIKFLILGSAGLPFLLFRLGAFFHCPQPLGRAAPSLPDPSKGEERSFDLFPLGAKLRENFVNVHMVPGGLW